MRHVLLIVICLYASLSFGQDGQAIDIRVSIAEGGLTTEENCFLALAAQQNAINANTVIELRDDVTGVSVNNGITYNNTTFRATLKANKTYKLTASTKHLGSVSNTAATYRWYDVTNATFIGRENQVQSMNSLGNEGDQPFVAAIITPTTDIEVELRCQTVSAANQSMNAFGTYAIIEKISELLFSPAGPTSIGNADSLGGQPAIFYVDTFTNQSISGIKTFTQSVGIGTASPNAVSILEIVSTTKGAVNAPLMTEAQRDAIGTPPEGLQIWNTDTKKNNSFNGTIWENAAFQPQNVVYVTQESDFGTPSGGAITLQENTVYILYNDDPVASQKTITLTNRLQIPDAGGVRITSVGVATCILSYTGTGNFITTTSSFTGFLHIDELFISVPNGTLFNIDGVLPVGGEFFPRVFLSDVGFFNTKNLGIIKNISYNQSVSAFFDCKQGITFDHCEEIILSDIRFTDWQNDVGSVMITLKDPLRFPKISNCIFETKPNETLFDFQPSIPLDDVTEVSICIFKGTGATFATGTTGSITAIADVSTAGSITAVSGTPFGEVIFIDAAHGLSVHQFITTSTFSDANYNGTFEVLEVLHPDSFRVHTLFTATGTGSWTSDLIEITSTAHGLSDETGVQILNTNDNDGGGLTFNVTANTFEINGTFVATSTGDWNTNSLTQKDTRIFFNGNSGLINSQSIAIGSANANATLTSVADGTYNNIILTGFVADASITERFTLTNAANGIWTYIDSKPLSGIFHATISGIKTGATANYRFAVSINGAIPVFASAVYVPMEVKTSKIQVTLALPSSLVQGDTVQIMQAGDGTSDDITITDISILIR